MQPNPYSAPLALAAVIALLLAIVALRRRNAPGAIPFSLFSIGLSIWSGCYAVMWASTTLEAQRYWLHATYLGVGLVPASFLAFALQYTHRGAWLTRERVALLAVEPVLILVAIGSNEAHHLFHAQFALIEDGPYAILEWSRGPLFWVNVAYSYMLLLVGTALLFRTWSHSAGPYRSQSATLLIGALIPWGANIYTQAGLSPFGSLDLTPLAFAVTGVVMAWALFRHRLLDLVPVARTLLVERMGDGVVVVDEQGRIADINPAARAVLGLPDRKLIGEPAAPSIAGWLPIQEGAGEGERRIEVSLPDGRHFDLRATPLAGASDGQGGQLLVFRDITESKRIHHALEEANRRLHEELARVAELQAQLHELATRDPLTGLFNRRYLDETLPRELARAQRRNEPLALVMIDIDHFKQVNDTAGHDGGDAVLRALARHLLDHARTEDIVCRFGGEEFLVLLPRANRTQALHRAEEWRVGFAAQEVPFAGTTLTTTLSLGVATFPEEATGDALIRSADQALYRAKRSGRNRVV